MLNPSTMEVVTDKDLNQEANLTKRRYTELSRQGRIFDARNRIIGGDAHAWDIQVHDQMIRKETEKARHETFAAEMRYNDKIMCLLRDREQRNRRQLCKALNEFQKNSQKSETRREFDLYDLGSLRSRMSDSGKQNNVSGMQKFMGEDLNVQQRKRFQMEQNREWYRQQQRAWEKARANRKLAEDLHNQTRLKFDEAAQELQNLECATKKKVCAATKEFNKQQAIEMAERKKKEKQKEQEDNLAEINNLLHSELLLENQQQARSGSHVVPSHWKGMSREQLEEIRYVQKQQIQEKLRLQEEERQRVMDWDRRRIQKARVSLLQERQQQRFQREMRRALDCSNFSLAREQYLQKKEMDAASSSQPTEEYYSQFNTGGR
ncbi:RIB43A-like with coiled-coils protein 2 [Meriones unguiculatus]|uniref:RIB43A-like with coiled-coils protein 2 n=1 Tax=Meriones unguiculatus TaxID=10047 RepID=UPI00293E3D9B|nr:RIB43A-like with coiled-coils protein 2 [Meriones unguiculatus]